jgi:hypothetical protein
MNLEGQIDVKAEIAKMQKQLDRLQTERDRLNKQMTAKGYDEKVKPEVKTENANRVSIEVRGRSLLDIVNISLSLSLSLSLWLQVASLEKEINNVKKAIDALSKF